MVKSERWVRVVGRGAFCRGLGCARRDDVVSQDVSVLDRWDFMRIGGITDMVDASNDERGESVLPRMGPANPSSSRELSVFEREGGG